MDAKLAANQVAQRFVKNTNVKTFDPAWIISLVEIIISVIKYCQEKNELNSFRYAIQSAMSPWRRFFGVGRRTRAALRKAVRSRLIEANDEEIIRAILETSAEANDDDVLSLIKSVDQLDYNPWTLSAS